MSFQERRAIVSLVSTLLINALYARYMLQRLPQGDAYSAEVFHFWGMFFLVLIPVTVAAKIVIHIIFSVLNTLATQEAEPNIVDERDRLIELIATKNALYVFSIGFMLSMGVLVFNMPPTVMFLVLLGTGVLSESVSEVSNFYLYRQGVF